MCCMYSSLSCFDLIGRPPPEVETAECARLMPRLNAVVESVASVEEVDTGRSQSRLAGCLEKERWVCTEKCWGSRARSSLSKSNSYLWKPKFGKTMGLRLLTKLRPSRKVQPWSLIRYAITHVALRETPAKQCTRTRPPISRAVLIN